VPYWLNYQVSRKPRAQLKKSFKILFSTMRSKILSLSEKVSHILFMTCLCSI
jgi:DNA-binding transcriptional ArsR family regulator